MGRSPCCDKQGLKKGPWAPEEDKILQDYINTHGHGSWRSLPKLAGLLRCGKSCRLRWTNYLRPDIKRGPFTPEEQKSILQLHGIVGNKWSTIAAQLPGRTDNEIKNYWNTHLKKRLLGMGLNPDTYVPAAPSAAAATRHMAQWESARLEAEARLSRESLLFSSSSSTAGMELVEIKEEEPDIYLRMWNSEVGDAFRKANANDNAVVKPEGSSSTTKQEEDGEGKSCVVSGDAVMTAVTDSTSSTNEVVEEEAYQMYLDFAGDDYGLFQGQMGAFSLFTSDLNDASLDTAFK